MRRLLLLAVVAAGCVAQPPPCPPLRAEPWPEADRLFRRDPVWIGADAAYSVDLGRERVLWLFGDTFLAKTAARSRSDAWFVRNSVAIQSRSYDPSRADIHFYWRGGAAPGSFFPEDGERFTWPLGGARVGDGLVLFVVDEHAAAGGLGFDPQGSRALFVENPDDDPPRWRIRDAGLPSLPVRLAFGAGVTSSGDDLYAFAVREPGVHTTYLARLSRAALAHGDASQPRFWSGRDWVAPSMQSAWFPTSLLPASSRLDLPPVEMSLERTESGFRAVHSIGFGATRVAVRDAAAITGPWSLPCPIFTPPEAADPGAIEYSAKAHPELTGASMVWTYATNATRLERLAHDMNLYFPRFLRVEPAGD